LEEKLLLDFLFIVHAYLNEPCGLSLLHYVGCKHPQINIWGNSQR
jgi:hypothetical protein